MALLARLSATHLQLAVTSYRTALRMHQQAINRLNVYPVPDGDTGTNMALTLESVVAAMQGAQDMAATCKAIAGGSLMGARGNSGVILSQIMRGLANRFSALDDISGPDLAQALTEASDLAYAAVMRPVEGTILSVVKAAAAGAVEAADAGRALVDVVEQARVRAAEAVARTPDQLAVLKENGVVDAGGVGFVLLLDALLHAVSGRPLPEPAAEASGRPLVAATAAVTQATGAEAAGDERYEVMYLLDAPDDAIPVFKKAWAAIGDSIVVVGGDGLWNCHIHTDDIGAAVEAALDAGGRPRQIRVTDLHDQVAAEHCADEVPPAAAEAGPTAASAVVAVVSGDGLGSIFRSLGAESIVSGGQSMNPSTAEILEAVEASRSDSVVVLPNNANIVAVARQVDALTSKTVRVVPTTGMAQGLGALMAFDSATTADANADAMADAAGRVVSGEVTRAVRDSSTDAGPVRDGDWLGLVDGRIQVIVANAADAATGLLDRLVTDGHELVTLVAGEAAAPDDLETITAWVAEHHPDLSVEVHHGGQPLYPYLLAVE